MLYIELFVAFLIILGVVLLLKKKAMKDYEVGKEYFRVIYISILTKKFRDSSFPEVQASNFLFVNIDNKENYIIFGPNTKHRPLMEFFLEKHSEISGRSWLLPKPDIKIYGGGKIYYNPEKKIIGFYDGSGDFGFYEESKIEEFREEIKKRFSIETIDYSRDTYYNCEKALGES